MILVDSNVIIDVIEVDPEWAEWSMNQIAALSADHDLAINEIVVAEVGPALGSLATFRSEMAKIGVALMAIDEEAAFLAGLAFRAYRQNRRGGPKSILADFLIGGHAQSIDAAILTRDSRFYRAYFPKVPLIAP